MTKKRSSPDTPVRARSPHSMTMAASKSPATAVAIWMPGTPGEAISGGGAASAFTTVTSLPSARSAYAIAICEPRESPSGRECDEITKRCRVRMASTICWISGAGGSGAGVVIAIGSRRRVGLDLVEQLLDAVLARDRLVDHELQLGHALQPEPRSDLPPQERNRAVQCAVAGRLRLLV